MNSIKLITILFYINLVTAAYSLPKDAIATKVIKEHRDKVISELKGMGYSEYLIFDRYMIKECPDGHLGFVIAFTGMQFKTNRKYGYFCAPYINQSVEYVKRRLF